MCSCKDGVGHVMTYHEHLPATGIHQIVDLLNHEEKSKGGFCGARCPLPEKSPRAASQTRFDNGCQMFMASGHLLPIKALLEKHRGFITDTLNCLKNLDSEQCRQRREQLRRVQRVKIWMTMLSGKQC